MGRGLGLGLGLALGLVLLAGAAGTSAPARAQEAARPAAAAAAACDRECLRGKLTEVLYALVEHDPGRLAVAPGLRVTEDGVEKPLDKVGLARTATRLRGYRQDVIDERAGQAAAAVMIEESGAPVLLVARVRVDGTQRLSELELAATRSRADGMLFNLDGLGGAPARAMAVAPRPEQLAPRDQAVAIALHYPRGLNSAKTFDAVGTPFSKDAYRLENGALMAGPGCTFIKGCDDIGGQSLAVFQRLGRVTLRDVLVDERMGVVLMRLSWNRDGPGSDKLTAWEAFKVYDGQIHMVQAYMRVFPPALELGGWPVRPGAPQP